MFLLSKYSGNLAAHIRRFSFLLKNRLFESTRCQFKGMNASVCVLVCGAASAVWSSMLMHCIKCLRWDTSAVFWVRQMAYLHHWSANESVEGHVLKAEEEVPTPSTDIYSEYKVIRIRGFTSAAFFLCSHLWGAVLPVFEAFAVIAFYIKHKILHFYSLCLSLVKPVPDYKVTFTLHMSAVTLWKKNRNKVVDSILLNSV